MKKNQKFGNLFQDPSFNGKISKLSQKKQLFITDLDDPRIYDVYKYLLNRPGVSIDTYVHRAGRAGRAGIDGLCLTFVSNKYDENQMEYIKTCIKGIELNEITEAQFNDDAFFKKTLEETEEFQKSHKTDQQ